MVIFSMLGATLEEGTGATMSEDEDEPPMLEAGLDMGSDGHDMMGFGPLLPTDSERSLMERVRQELKIELKQVNKKIRRGQVEAL
jgi:hypothetical protein